MTHLKVKQFEAKMNEIIASQIERAKKDTEAHLVAFGGIKLDLFSNKQPYAGALSNTIFFTYSDHYHGNSGTWMSVSQLSHAHTDMDDRGYIKGVATDLDGYLLLKNANTLSHNIEPVANIYFPRFKKSKYSTEYAAACSNIVTAAIKMLNDVIVAQKAILNQHLNDLTGCSLLYYLRAI